MLEVEETKVWRISEKFVLHKLEEEMYWIFDIKEGDHFELNFTSYFILSCFDGKTPLSKVRERLISKYHKVDTQTVSNDLEELLEKMIKEGILESI